MSEAGLSPVTASGRYTNLERIAVGGMAEVFRAIQHGECGFRRTVVLKRILPAMAADPKFQNAFLDEAHIAMTFHHGNVVPVLDVVQTNGSWFLVMDLVDGWNLAAILKRSRTADLPLPLALGLYITAELCRGIAYVHARKRPDGQPLAIVHRDINPQNVLISQDGEVKVTDFGIAKAIDRREHTFVGLIKGHPDFMSPEQASGGELDAASDIFSIGSVLYRLATGTAPFSSASDLETLLRVQAGKFVPPEGVAPDLPAAVITILKTAMQLDPSHRYRTAGDLMRALEEVLRSGGVTGRSELQRWLVELRDRDGELPTSEAPCLPADPEDPSAAATAVPPLSRRRHRTRTRPRRTPVALAIVCGTIAVTAPPPGNQVGREASQPAIPDVSAAVQRLMPAAAATIQADMPATALAEELSHEEPERGEGALTSAAAADANGEVRASEEIRH